MGFTIDNRPDEANAYAKPNSFLRFGYTVKNLNGTPYNEPYLTDVVVSIYDINDSVPKKTFNFTNGTSHQSGTNVIAFALEIKDSELPKGKYRWEINHKRTINSVVENNVMFEGSFEVTSKHRSGCSITELIVTNTGIASITGLREELDALKLNDNYITYFEDFFSQTLNQAGFFPFISDSTFSYSNDLTGKLNYINFYDLEQFDLYSAKNLLSQSNPFSIEGRFKPPLVVGNPLNLKFGFENSPCQIHLIGSDICVRHDNGAAFIIGHITDANYHVWKIEVNNLTATYTVNGTVVTKTLASPINGRFRLWRDNTNFEINNGDNLFSIDYLKAVIAR